MGRVLLDKPDPVRRQTEPISDKKQDAAIDVVEEEKEKEISQAAQVKEEDLHSDSKKDSATKEGGNESKPTERTEEDGGNEAPKVYRPPGLLVTPDLQEAVDKCRRQVERIAKDCRTKNRKFRDTEFDLEGDSDTCLHGIVEKVKEPTGVQRVTEIFDAPHFFNPDGVASSNDICQGALGDCWFLSGLATISSVPRLVEEICVARDEEVGVYGFVFYKDSGWKSIIVDDMLCTNMPKYEELSPSERDLYHDDKKQFNKIARQGGKALTFAKSGVHGETWVPLIEKAYAKFYGNFSHIEGGFTREAIEDLTGGVATLIHTKDIFDRDHFWKEELLKANQDRLFACAFEVLKNTRNGEDTVRVEGLFGGHAYSVLRAVECKGKRFLVIRNPWGKSEWTGRWSDGSKEWAGEWLQILPELGHGFGDDGQFVMEYDDFLQCFTQIDKSLLFDSNWVMASQWLTVPVEAAPSPWTYGKVSFLLSVPCDTRAVISLSQLNRRFYQSIPQNSFFSLGFVVVKQGETEPMDESIHTRSFTRSVNTELDLDAGIYFVYVKIEHTQMIPIHEKDDDDDDDDDSEDEGSKDDKEKPSDTPAIPSTVDSRKLAKVISEKVIGQSLSPNYVQGDASKFVPVTLEQVIQKDIAYMSKHKGRPRRIPKKSLFKRIFRIGEKTPALHYQLNAEEPEDPFVGLLDASATQVTLGLKVFTKSEAPVAIIGRLEDDM
ncbi:hypothetical protein H1R20_g6336, partial [Candolleomyces eurysporus]